MESNLLYQTNQDITNNILKSMDFSKNKDIFVLLLNGIKNNCGLCALLDQGIIEKLLVSPQLFDEEYEKAQVINCILNILCNIEYDYRKNKNKIHNFLKMYLGLISRGYHYLENINETLSLFAHLGVEKRYIISQLCKCCNEEFLLQILLKMKTDFVNEVSRLYPELGVKLKDKIKLFSRFDLLLHFYLMTNTQYYENIDIMGDFLKKYNDYVLICADWAFSSRHSFNHKYVLDSIISEEEEKVFIEIGDLFYNCLDESANDEEELFKNLRDASERFYSKLREEKTQEIINNLFKKRQFFEIVLCTSNEGQMI